MPDNLAQIATYLTADLDVRLTFVEPSLTLDVADAALLGQRLIDLSMDAVHESRSRRRAAPVTPGVCANVGVRGVVGPCVRPYPHPDMKHLDPLGRVW